MSSNDEIVKKLHQLLAAKSKNVSVYSDLESRLANPQIKEMFSMLVFMERDHKELIEQALSLLAGKI